MPRSGISSSYNSSVFSFQRNLHTVLHSGINVLKHTSSCLVDGAPPIHQCTLFSIKKASTVLEKHLFFFLQMFSNTSLNALRNVRHFHLLLQLCGQSSQKKMYLGTSVLQVFLALQMHCKTCSILTYNSVLNAAASSFLEKSLL